MMIRFRQAELTEVLRTVEHMKTLPYEVGDRVRHARFGVGSVLEIKDGKQDFEVTVEFDELGRRKMLAGFAKLEKLTS